ncbi:hypothetical protein [Phenylobacterium sp.]|jgi:hypothetical protein|uniref:hypothetical protein n=1 Tax=Phenylobacterium sp. TaxID=1871053 RepID=UPI002F9513C3
MLRPSLLVLAVLLPLAACNSVGGSARNTPENKAVSAVVLDESKRQEAAAAATATKSSSDAMAEVREGPKDQAPIPN